MSRLREFEDRLLPFAKSKVFHVVLLKRNLYRTDELGIELFPEALTNMHIAVLGELSGVAGGVKLNIRDILRVLSLLRVVGVKVKSFRSNVLV